MKEAIKQLEQVAEIVSRVRAQIGNDIAAAGGYAARMDEHMDAARSCADHDMQAAHLMDALHNAEVSSFAVCKHRAGDTNYYARGPVPAEPWHAECINAPVDLWRELLAIKNSYMGVLCPNATLDSDCCTGKRTEHYIAGCAASGLYEWLADAWATRPSMYPETFYFGPRPSWAEAAEKELIAAQECKVLLDRLHGELAIEAYREWSGAEPEESLSTLLGFEPINRSVSIICENIKDQKDKLASLPDWARYAKRRCPDAY